jgi:ATP-dependent DNA helicase RecQ
MQKNEKPPSLVNIDWPQLARRARELFGIRRFRPGQKELMEAVLKGHDAIGVLPTGAGKSLTYQLPALLMEKSVLVVSPLLSLMQDQQEKLEHVGIEAARVDSTLSTSEKKEIICQIESGSQDLIYVTPEHLEKPEHLEFFRSRGIALFVVDEAHCVSQWGHDFRPAYLHLRHAVEQLGRPPILALTATATPDVLDDIIQQLGMRRPRRTTLGVERANIFLEVAFTVNAEAKHQKLLELVTAESGTGLIYVATVKAADELGQWLQDEGVTAGIYHGKLKSSVRQDTQRRFMANEYKVVVATKAFGMGIDKPDLRFVIHYNFPDSIESYYQEIGRSGRDGKPARAILLFQLEDKRIQSYFLGGKYPSPEESRRYYEGIRSLAQKAAPGTAVRLSDLKTLSGLSDRRSKVIAAQLDGAGIIRRDRQSVIVLRDFSSDDEFDSFLSTYEDRHKTDHEKLEAMMKYGQTAQCRMAYIRAYFGEDAEASCGHCDNCLTPLEERLGIQVAPALDREAASSLEM